MNMTKLRVFGLLSALMATAIVPSASAQDRLFSSGANQKAEALLKQMTVDEKVGQLNESSGIVMPGIATEKPDDLIAKGGGPSGPTSTNLPPPSPPPATESTCATPAASNPVGGGGIYKQIVIDPGVYGKRDTSGLTVFGFSQEGQNLPADPQVLAMSPNIVSRAWQRWDRGGVQPSDYNFGYPMQARAAGIAFIGGTTATALFRDEFPAASTFNAVVSCDATGQPVFHSAMKFYRGSLASPACIRSYIGSIPTGTRCCMYVLA